MPENWSRLKQWAKFHAPVLLKGLNEGVKPQNFEELEKLTGVNLPAGFKAFYSVHNGQNNDEFGLIDGDQLLQIEDIILLWHFWCDSLENGDALHNEESKDHDPRIKLSYWDPEWIPFTHDGSGNHLCLDFAPTATGKEGQVICIYRGSLERKWKAESFWLTTSQNSNNGTLSSRRKWVRFLVGSK
jgi:cell wall assembly regulator SMI1